LAFEPVKVLANEFYLWGVIVASFTLLLGVISSIWLNVSRIAEGKAPRSRIINSWTYIVFLVVMMILALSDPSQLTKGFYYQLIYTWILGYASQGMRFGVIGGNIYGAYLTFSRTSTIESALLFLGFLLTTFREMTFYAYIFPPFIPVGDWIAFVINVAAERASYLAVGAGSVIMAVRAIVGREPGLIEMEMA
jgi:hypothetical protein